jgi:DNA-nicking Smr family endonuclease
MPDQHWNFSTDDTIRIPVTDVLDLHSVPRRDAEAVVEEYLSEARRLQFSVLRIIHGRGIGVQRETVRRVLARTPFATHQPRPAAGEPRSLT